MSQDARGSWAESSRVQKPFGHPWHQAKTLEARSNGDLQKAAATWEVTAHRDRHNERGAAPHLPPCDAPTGLGHPTGERTFCMLRFGRGLVRPVTLVRP
ncbi:MAG: hypothetical protein ACPIOQ_61350, partial [Promethearchaeia archaeon]